MKPIRCSNHAKLQMVLRGATEEEVTTTVKEGRWEAARLRKSKSIVFAVFKKKGESKHE